MNTITDDSNRQCVSLVNISYTYHAATHTMRYLSISLNNSYEQYMYMCGKLVMFFYSYTTIHISQWTITFIDYTYVNLIMNTIR